MARKPWKSSPSCPSPTAAERLSAIWARLAKSDCPDTVRGILVDEGQGLPRQWHFLLIALTRNNLLDLPGATTNQEISIAAD